MAENHYEPMRVPSVYIVSLSTSVPHLALSVLLPFWRSV